VLELLSGAGAGALVPESMLLPLPLVVPDSGVEGVVEAPELMLPELSVPELELGVVEPPPP